VIQEVTIFILTFGSEALASQGSGEAKASLPKIFIFYIVRIISTIYLHSKGLSITKIVYALSTLSVDNSVY
ncbi:MAG: hypothetical protein QM500_05920, partial [Methylococcales bacterium]